MANLLAQNAVVTATIWQRSRFRPGLVFSQPHLRALWSYGQYTLLLSLAAFTANQSPRLIVGYLFGPAALGAFSLGLRIVEIIFQLIIMPATNVLVPAIARMREPGPRLENAILSATQLIAMMAVPVYVAMAVTAPVLIPLLFGAKCRQCRAAAMAVHLWRDGVLRPGLAVHPGRLGRPDIALRATILAAIANVAVLLLAARWGVMAAAIAFVIRSYLTMPFMPLVLARLTGVPAVRQYRVYVPIAVAALAMALCGQGGDGCLEQWVARHRADGHPRGRRPGGLWRGALSAGAAGTA